MKHSLTYKGRQTKHFKNVYVNELIIKLNHTTESVKYPTVCTTPTITSIHSILAKYTALHRSIPSATADITAVLALNSLSVECHSHTAQQKVQ
jgi:hypothetical protein